MQYCGSDEGLLSSYRKRNLLDVLCMFKIHVPVPTTNLTQSYLLSLSLVVYAVKAC
jgi:hypothetical protein